MPAVSFSGIASGIDGEAIIKATIDAKRLATEPMKTIVESNKNENTALEELTTKLLGLRDSVKDFRTLSGSAISKRASSSNDDAVSVSAANNAIVSSTTINVTNLAQSATFSFDDRFSDPLAPLAPGLTGTANLTVTVGQGASAMTIDVPITNTTSLSDLVGQVNELGGGKVLASAVNVGTESAPQYLFLMNTTETGVEKGTLQVSADSALVGSGLFATSTLSQAEDAVFSITGIGQITRSSNKVTGLIPGVTLNLKQENVGPVLVGIADDSEKTAEKFETMIGKLNELIKYQHENDQIERVEENGKIANKYGTLAKVRVDNQAINSLRSALTDANSGGAGTEVNILADLGVTIERDGSYKFDKDKFTTSVATDSLGAGAVLSQLADRLASTNGLIDEYTKFQGQFDISIRSNEDENTTINDRLERVEANLDKQAQALKLVFANLETKVGQLNSQASAITSILGGGGGVSRKS